MAEQVKNSAINKIDKFLSTDDLEKLCFLSEVVLPRIKVQKATDFCELQRALELEVGVGPEGRSNSIIILRRFFGTIGLVKYLDELEALIDPKLPAYIFPSYDKLYLYELAVRVSDQLEDGDFKRLKFLIPDGQLGANRDRLTTPVQLFRRLIEEQTLSVSKEAASLELLKGWLAELGRKDIVQLVKAHKRPVPEQAPVLPYPEPCTETDSIKSSQAKADSFTVAEDKDEGAVPSSTDSANSAEQQDLPTVSQLQETFSALYKDVIKVLQENASVNDIFAHIAARPAEEIEEHDTFIQKVAKNLGTFNINQFVYELRKYIQFLDCKLLKEIVREYASPDLLRRIDNYERTVEAFCKNTRIASFIQNWNGQWKVPDNFVELKAKLNLDPDKSTLHEIQERGRELWRRFTISMRPRLYDLCSMVFHKVQTGCIYGIWIVPRKLVEELRSIFKRGTLNDFLVENKFLKIAIDFQVVYSYEAEQHVRSFLEQNPGVSYVGREVFYHCREHIRPLLDNSALLPHLKKYDMLWDPEDEDKLVSPYHTMEDTFSSLINVVEREGVYGYMLLYMCIHQSQNKPNSHSSALEILDAMAEQKKTEPPYERSGISPDTPYMMTRRVTQCPPLQAQDDISKDGGDDDQSEDTGFVEGGTTTEYASTNEPTDHYPAIQSASELREHFAQVATSHLDYLIMSRTHAEDVRKVVADLPFLSFSGRTDDPIPKEIEQIENSKILNDLFHFLNTNVWNFFDYHLLAHVIGCLGNDPDMKQYTSCFKKFQGNTTLDHFFGSWPGRKQKPRGYVPVVMSIGGSLEQYTVAKLNKLRQYICVKYLPPQSHYAMLFYKHQREKMEVTWVMPSKLAAILNKAIGQSEARDNLRKKFQVTVSIPEVDVIPERSPQLLPASSEQSLIGPYTKKPFFDNSSDSPSSETSPDLTPTNDKESRVDPAELTARLKQLHLRIPGISLEFKERQRRDRRSKTDKGCFPNITLNNDGVVVEVNHQQGTNWTFCRVGYVMSWGIKWGHPATSATPPQKVFYGSGANPQVSLNNSNTLVEVHKGQFLDRCFIRLGEVDPSAGMIRWHRSTYFNVGLLPVVAVNNSGTVVSVFQDNVFTKHLNYRVGCIKSKKKINWLYPKMKAQVNNAVSFSIDINDNDIVILSYQNLMNHIHYKVGKIVKNSISWTTNVHFSKGYTPSVTINNNNEVVLVQQSLVGRRIVSSVGVARWDDQYRGIVWSCDKDSCHHRVGKGLYPSVALNDAGQVVEAHEPSMAPTRNRLHYYTAELKHY